MATCSPLLLLMLVLLGARLQHVQKPVSGAKMDTLSNQSSGCGHAFHGVTGKLHSRTLMVGDTERDYLLWVPQNYDLHRAYPLLLSFHGASASPVIQALGDQLFCLADVAPYIVAYPAAYSRDNPYGYSSWNVPGSTTRGDSPPEAPCIRDPHSGGAVWGAQETVEYQAFSTCNYSGWEGADASACFSSACVDDEAFAKSLVAAIDDELCVDRDRLSLHGHSMGGVMALWLGAEALSGRASGVTTWAAAPFVGRNTQPRSSTALLSIDAAWDSTIPNDARLSALGKLGPLGATVGEDGWLYTPSINLTRAWAQAWMVVGDGDGDGDGGDRDGDGADGADGDCDNGGCGGGGNGGGRDVDGGDNVLTNITADSTHTAFNMHHIAEASPSTAADAASSDDTSAGSPPLRASGARVRTVLDNAWSFVCETPWRGVRGVVQCTGDWTHAMSLVLPQAAGAPGPVLAAMAWDFVLRFPKGTESEDERSGVGSASGGEALGAASLALDSCASALPLRLGAVFAPGLLVSLARQYPLYLLLAIAALWLVLSVAIALLLLILCRMCRLCLAQTEEKVSLRRSSQKDVIGGSSSSAVELVTRRATNSMHADASPRET